MGKTVGIDLGTTNSLVGYGEELYTGLVSSNVNIREKKQVSREVISNDVVSSYKTNMTIGSSGEIPIKCSSIILKELIDRAMQKTGSYIDNVVISVPAKFSHTQRQAVWKAAEDANLNVLGLINEPTAAAIYVCKDLKDLVVVYDLGGGTFDVTILDSRIGSYSVVATDGNSKLAGDNLDRAFVNKALNDCKVKIRFRTNDNLAMLSHRMQLAKEAFQKTGLPQFVDMSELGCLDKWELNEDIYISEMKRTFLPTIQLTNQIVRTNLMDTDKPKLVFVGGSTACPYLRKWVEEETGLTSIECNEQPDLIVARGVALYAKMLEDGRAVKEVEDVTKHLCIENELGMAETIIEKNTIIPTSEVRTFANTDRTRYLNINLYQGDSLFCRDNDFIGTLIFDYGDIREPNEGIVEIEIKVDRNGRVSLSCTDIITCEKQEIELKL